ncbi:serine/threonine-protein kinase [Ascoidea rubescens DSM 1968]|uniref:non-specific serine/threonine protein kinase n=1 Tax=Ascoidea rubescens DSM 1968 TaxID=1344418 RepID=A0A1D2VJF6_9ASCO|nr:protein kinase [Ascoidea rubescens DSM 1968]ODV61752.1 protein kinase [Ascoidea rubescens DSM 1968]
MNSFFSKLTNTNSTTTTTTNTNINTNNSTNNTNINSSSHPELEEITKKILSIQVNTTDIPTNNNNNFYTNQGNSQQNMNIFGNKQQSQINLFYDSKNKENNPPASPTKSVQYGNTNYSNNVNRSHYQYAKRLDRDFYLKANSPKNKRLVNVCQMYFLDYYCDMFDYVISRRQRQQQAEENILKIPNQQERLYQWKSYTGKERALLRKRRIKPKHKDFSIITQVGQGGYGQVYLARKKDTREIVALKVLSKRLLMKLDETKHVLTERDILTNTRSEWLVKLFYAFQDKESVYLAMEFVPGGDYRTLLNNTGVLIPPHARFYISEMFASVNALHILGYTHRDLKPENFLIDAKGHIKLTDFGLAAGSVSTDRIENMRQRLAAVKDLNYGLPTGSVSERQKSYRSLRQKDIHYANSIVGSPDYMALEVLEGKPYDYTIDYWSLGCMLFETLVGYPPFSGNTPNDTYANLRHWKQSLRRPKYDNGKYVFSDRTWHLIVHLINSPNERLRSFSQIKMMPYFNEIDWDNLRTRVPPFTPQLDDEEDAGYFDDFTNEEDMAKYKEVIAKKTAVERMNDKEIDDRYFIGFTFKHSGSKNVSVYNDQSIIYSESDPFATWY